MRRVASSVPLAWGRLAYTTQGSGTPLVLLHSLALSGRMWDLVGAELGAHHELIAVDLRGHGGSEWDGQPFTIDDLASDVIALLDQLQLPRAHVLGMSMGGTVAVALASAAPQRVDRLALCDTTAWYGPEAFSAWEQRAATAERSPRVLQVPFQTERWFGGAFRRRSPAEVSAVVGIFLGTSPAAHAKACRALGAYDGRARLASITAATLVVTGEDDQATPVAMGKLLADAIPGATGQVWPGLRHFALLESATLRTAVLAHLAGEAVPEPSRDLCCCPATSVPGGPTT